MMSPKARFLTHPTDVAVHRSLVVSPPFVHATDVALLQMIQNLCTTGPQDIQSSANNFHKIAGAVEYRKQLLTLADTPTVIAVKKDPDNLQKT